MTRSPSRPFPLRQGGIRTVLAAVALSVALAISVPALAGILYPPSPGMVTESAELVIMAHIGDKEPLAATFTPNVGEPVKKTFSKGYNTWEVTLTPGLNYVEYGADKLTVYLTSREAPGGTELKQYRLHEAMDDCFNCHAEDGEGTALKDEVATVCYECHDSSEGKKSIHSPVADGDCLSCHQAHFSVGEKLVDLAVPELCWECHDNVTKGEDGAELASQHEPVAGGECLECHAVHATDFPSLTRDEQAKVCANCHDDPTLKEDGGKKSAIHEPVGAGECTSCHLVHGGREKPLLTAPPEELCKECHDLPFTDDEGQEFPFMHEPADSAECLSCHDAHASDAKGILLKPDPELCYECHENPTKAAKGVDYPVVHAVLEDGCLACHKPHGGKAAKLLPAAGKALCVECHDDVTLSPDSGDPLPYVHTVMADGRCVACHNPHASPVVKLLPKRGNQLCYLCHKEFHEIHRTNVAEGERKIAIPETFPMDRGDMSCRGCHNAHASKYEMLLPKERMMLCGDCHRQ